MRNRIPHLLISMSSQSAAEEKGFRMKKDQKLKITWVEIAWVEEESVPHMWPHFKYKNDQCNEINTG